MADASMDGDDLRESFCSLKQYNPSSGRNKHPILEALRPKVDLLREKAGGNLRILEIASGSGEHAAFFGSHLESVDILPVEPDTIYHTSINAWRNEDKIEEEFEKMKSVVREPVAVDVRVLKCSREKLPPGFCDDTTLLCMICINMIHISAYECTEALFDSAAALLPSGGQLFTYGPYRVNGEMTESNWAFDKSLEERDTTWGIRAIERVTTTAEENGFTLSSVEQMPANNLFLTFTKS